ncbi:acyl carrier protein [Streptomyces sp. NPDC055796]
MNDPITAPEVTRWLTGHLAALTDIPGQDIDPTAPLDTLGITSMEEVMITADLEARYGLALPLPEMRRHPSIEALAAYITSRAPDNAASATSPVPGAGTAAESPAAGMPH